MNNADLSLDFLKKCQKCRENGVPNDMAILAALHDIADYKDKEWLEKSQNAYVNTYDNSNGESYVELVIDDSPTKFKEAETVKVIVINDENES